MNTLKKLIERKNLPANEAEELMQLMMDGKFTNVQAAAILVALKMKGETEEEITAFARIMRKNAIQIKPKINTGILVDTCGTGGDGTCTFNISTTAAFIAAGAGCNIAKHGNRSVSGKCGSADVLEMLGAKMLEPKKVEECIEKTGIGFMFAPYFHPAMKNVAVVRKELGVRTVFNILGPLTNPANAQAQLIGVFDPMLTEPIARILGSLGSKRILTVHSEGMDEIGLGKTKISELKNGNVETYEINASDFGLKKCEIPKVNSAQESANIIKNILKNKENGPAREISTLNASAVIYVGGNAHSIAQGLELASESIDSGKAYEKLEQLIDFSNSTGV